MTAEPYVGKRHAFDAGSTLDSGHGHVLIESGVARLLARGPAGEQFFLTLVGPGAGFGPEFAQMLGHDSPVICIESVTAVTIREFTGRDWDRFTLKHPEANRAMIAYATELLGIVKFHLTHHCRRDSLERTRYALWSYAQHFGTRSCGKTTVRVSRNELASCVGVSCDRITRLVRKLHSTAEIAIQGRSIVVYPELAPAIAKQLPAKKGVGIGKKRRLSPPPTPRLSVVDDHAFGVGNSSRSA